MKTNCPDCSKEHNLTVTTENIMFFLQKCPYCGGEHTAVVRGFKIKDGQIVGELVSQQGGHLDIRRDNHG